MLLSEYPTGGNCLSNPTRGNPNMKPLPPHPTHYRQMDDSHRVTVFSRDVDGRTALHIAARIGRSHLTRVWRLGLGGGGRWYGHTVKPLGTLKVLVFSRGVP